MSRNKKNWDALVDYRGAYDFQGEKGYAGPPGSKGSKGTDGFKGEKGQASGVFNFRGSVPTVGDLSGPTTDPKNSGDVWKVEDVDEFWVYTGTTFILLSTALSVVKGEKGEKGQEGQDGEKGEKGQGGQKGTSGVKGQKGGNGEKGLKGLIGVAGAKGIKGALGNKGEVGDEGSKGEKGQTGIQGVKGEKGIDGSKGEKGTFGDKGQKGGKGEIGQGVKGVKGSPGKTFTYRGEVANSGLLPPTATEGDVYKDESTGDYYAWNGTSWDNIGQLNALKGEKGRQGDKAIDVTK